MTDEQIIKEATEAVEKGLDAGYAVSQLLDLINRQNAEIERLTVENLQMVASIKRLEHNAVKEFAKTLKARAFNDADGDYIVLIDQIDNLLAEMTDPTITKVEHNSLCETETYKKGG